MTSDVAARPTERQAMLAALIARRRNAAGAIRAGDGPIRASLMQEGIWVHEQLNPASCAYQISVSVRFTGPLDPELLAAALRGVVDRHDVLRTSFTSVDGRPFQVVAADVPLSVARIDARTLSAAELDAMLSEVARAPFDLASGPLFRTTLVRAGDEEWLLAIVVHHIVWDFSSRPVFMRELHAFYGALLANSTPALLPLPLRYADYVAHQRQRFSSTVKSEQLAYWTRQLANLPVSPRFLSEASREPATTQVKWHLFEVSASLAGEVRALSQRLGVSLFVTTLAAFYALLHRTTAEVDLVTAVPIDDRSLPGTRHLIGFFVNTLLMRVRLSPAMPFESLVLRVSAVVREAFDNGDVPLSLVAQALQKAEPAVRLRLPEIAFSFGAAAADRELSFGAARGEVVYTGANLAEGSSPFSLEFRLRNRGAAGFAGGISYRSDVVDRATVQRLAEHFVVLLASAAAAPRTSLADLPSMSDAERERVVREWNATARDEGGDTRCVHELFEDRVLRAPEAIAVVCEDERLTYRELDQRANRLAHELVRRGTRPGDVIALCMERSTAMIVSLYGVLKAGAAYAPLDPSHPQERLAFLVRDLGSAIVLTSADLAPRLAGIEGILCVDERTGAGLPSSRPVLPSDDRRLVSVIYTSGSTGTPKGVMNVHRGLRNRLAWMQEEYPLASDDVVLQKTPFTFDVSAPEIFGTLAQGARLVIARPGGHRDPDYMEAAIRQHGVTYVHFVPSMLAVFLEHLDRVGSAGCATLRRVACSGEALTRARQERLYEHIECELVNLYGPTEASVEVAHWRCLRGTLGEIPIGRPIWNTQLYVLDAAGHPCPIGVAGELSIGGMSLANGYLGRAALTAERFVPDPFSSTPGSRLYRTGDVVRWLSDGALDYQGRVDHQVKIGGVRIELGEVEAVLEASGDVHEAVVVAAEDGAETKRLVAYLVLAPERRLETIDLRAYLKRTVPDSMIPSAFVVLDTLPLNRNGKVDRSRLPAPRFLDDAVEYVAPRTKTEESVVGIVRDVLGVTQPVGVNDRLQAIGVDSLSAMRIVARGREAFGAPFPLKWVIEADTVAQLAAKLDAREVESGEA